MQIGHRRGLARALATAVALASALPALAQSTGGPAVIWKDPGDIAALDLADGPGGKGHEPGIDFTFVKESRSGRSPKFEVVDENGTTWMVKVGEEAKSETAATRLLWAAGYLVDEDYYRARIHVAGLPRLTRGQAFVSPDGIVSGARLERHEGQASTTWSWYENPFVGTREFNGLRVMMALVNNWDLKEINNSAAAAPGGGVQYGVTDLGATFGRTGDSLSRSKSVPRDYATSRFISRVTPTHVDLVMQSRPFFLSVFNFPNYRNRTRMESIARDIPIADVRWIGRLLGQLSAAQVGDGFRAGGYSSADVEANTRVVMQRIAVLQAIDPPTSSTPVIWRADVMVPVVAGLDADKCLASTCRQAPTRETLSAIGIGTSYARAIVGGFEQGAGLGGGVQVTSAGVIPVVELRAAALASTKRYRRFDVEAYLPHIGGSRNHVDVWLSHLKRDLDFFGVGPPRPDLTAQFTIVRRSYQGSAYRDLADHTQGGVYVQIMSTDSSRAGAAGDGATGSGLPNTPDQPPARWMAGVVSNTRVLSVGGFLTYDTRDKSEGLTRGVDLYGRAASANGLGASGGSSGYGWIEGEFDLRGYAPLGSPRTSLLLRSRGQFTTPKAGRWIPFYDLPSLGGREDLRGYQSYRFRGTHVLLLSSELQQTVYAISEVRGIDVFGSADAGRVWRDLSASSTLAAGEADAGEPGWHPSLGGGLQYRHSPSVAVRVEVGRSREGTLMYWSLSRGF